MIGEPKGMLQDTAVACSVRSQNRQISEEGETRHNVGQGRSKGNEMGTDSQQRYAPGDYRWIPCRHVAVDDAGYRRCAFQGMEEHKAGSARGRGDLLSEERIMCERAENKSKFPFCFYSI